ncbi:MAG: hypothetical protein NT029_05195, partial [Armatimonadetes bacterium]|nr:hypothetical protein [Armatimonadota bacterium]
MYRSRDGTLCRVPYRRLCKMIADAGGKLNSDLTRASILPGDAASDHIIYNLDGGRIALLPANGRGAGAIYASLELWQKTLDECIRMVVPVRVNDSETL